MDMECIDPPLHVCYYALMEEGLVGEAIEGELSMVDESCELPMIDLRRLKVGQLEREKCIKEIVKAASEWGFFQIVNHGMPKEVFKVMEHEQKKLFKQPYNNKSEVNFLNLSGSYRWGNPVASSPSQISWSEAFHIAAIEILKLDQNTSLRPAVEAMVATLSSLAQMLAEILGQNLGIRSSYFEENCPIAYSYLRLNRYPPCPFASEVYGLIPHTDSGFLTILHQDQVAGLQLLKDGKWFGVEPNPEALLVNIGDLFQAMSNDVYKSLKHRVKAAEEVERFSLAFFYCPSNIAIIGSCSEPRVYRHFSFGEYRQQIKKDVNETGNKVGLSRFLISPPNGLSHCLN